MSSEGKGLTIDQILKEIDNLDTIDEKRKIEVKIQTFYKFVKWTDSQHEEYKELYEKLNSVNRKSSDIGTKEKGDTLENIVDFIFNKSFFLEVHPNKRNSTNEIDQFVVISQNGKQALHDYNLSKNLLGFEEDYMICECKNYNKKVASTWIGKFSTLMDCCGECQLGIMFSYHGLTGKENNWSDAHGLTKVIHRISPKDKKVFILDFNKEDFERLLNKNCNIFDIIISKKKSLMSGVKSYRFLEDTQEEKDEIINIYNEVRNQIKD